MSEKVPPKQVTVKTIVISLLALILFIVIIASLTVYLFPRSTASKSVRHLIPFSAIMMGDAQDVSFRDIDTDLISIRRFYESQSEELSQAGLRVDFSTPEGQKRLMVREKELINKLLEDKAVMLLAQKKGISITSDDARTEMESKMKEFGNNPAEVAQKLQKLYGWNDMTDFQNKVVMPSLYRDVLSQKYADGIDVSSHGKKKIQDAQQQLQSGKSFEAVAAEYSEGQTARDGGELGYIPTATITPEIRQVALKSKLNEVSPVIESPFGFHIIVVEERSQEQGQEVMRLKQIFTKKLSFPEWLTQQMKLMNITVLYKGYKWNKDTARIEFKQPEMKSFEENLLNSSQGDASVLF